MGLYAFSGVELQPKTFNRAVHLGPGWSLLVRATTKIHPFQHPRTSPVWDMSAVSQLALHDQQGTKYTRVGKVNP